MNESNRLHWRAAVLRLVAELVIVFFGVYAAFALSEYQAQRGADERRQQIQIALVREIQDITDNTRNAAVQVGRMVSFYDSAFTAGATPIPVPMLEPVRVQTHMWESVLGSGGLDLLEVSTIYQLSEFYNELNAGFAQLEQLRELSQALLIPSLDGGVSEFYERPGRLRNKYSWYLPALRNLQRLAERITAMGDGLVAALRNLDEESLDPLITHP